MLWAVACCLPLATVGLANLALGVYSYDSTPEPWEAPVYWTLTVVPLLALGTACWSAFTQRLFRSSVALLSLVSAGVIYYVDSAPGVKALAEMKASRWLRLEGDACWPGC